VPSKDSTFLDILQVIPISPEASWWGKVSPTIHTSSYFIKSFILLVFPNFISIHITSGKK